MITNQSLRRIKNLGVTDFETVAATQQRQDDMLRRLEHALSDPRRLACLADCNQNYCGRIKCSEVCQFGTRRRRQREITAVHRLLGKNLGPVYEVRVGRSVWTKLPGKLDTTTIAAAKKLNRRALDKLYVPALIAVGTFKAFVAPKDEGGGWKCEIHQIIAGVKKKDIERAFASSRQGASNSLKVTEVTNLGQTISDVLKREILGWQHPYRSEITPPRPKKAHREEYYSWLLTLSRDERMVRYGCDRYFNKLAKQPRTVKIKKRHPPPHWLAPYQFGTEFGDHPQNCSCNRCNPYPESSRSTRSV